MALNPQIILAGQPVDVVGAMRQGNAAAAETNALRMQNDLTNLYRTQGAQIMAGDPNALNALAMRDPMAAMDIQAKRQDMTYRNRQLEVLNAEEKRAIAQEASRLSEAQKAAALQAAQQEVLRFVMAPDAATFDQMVTQAGKPELAGMYDQRERLGALYMDDFAKAMEMAVGPKAEPSALTEGAPSGTMWIDPNNRALGVKPLPGVEANPPKPPETRTARLPDGSDALVQWNPQTQTWDPAPIPQGGTTAQPRDRLTETQSRLTLFQSLQTDTSPVLDQIEAKWNPANVPDAAARAVPIAGNFFQSQEGQIYSAAAAAWAEGALRIATGAAATEPEIQRTVRTYFAQPGDLPQTVQFKNAMRASYERAIQRSLGVRNVQGTLTLPADFAASLITQQGVTGEGPTQEPLTSAGEVPSAFVNNPAAKSAADRAGVPVEELWEFLSPEARERLTK